MKKKGRKAKIVYVGRGVVFVRRGDGRLVRVKTGGMTMVERVYTSRVVGRD
jgi:hypothetical protein